MRRLAPALLVPLLLAPVAAPALESDQYYASARPIEDSSEVINAKINRQIRETLDHLNRRHARKPVSCGRAAQRISRAFKMFIFQDIELWVLNTSQVARIPSTPEEELHYRRVGLFRKSGPVDFGASLPPVPTIEIDGIRLGTDKLSHFFAEGWRYHRRYVRARKSGRDETGAVQRAMRIGFFLEKTVLGLRTSGVFSFGDLEANYQGMRFYRGLCEGDDPALAMEGNRWVLARPVDIREYVSPEWDESYRNSIFSRSRWRKVRPVLLGYCPLLVNPLTVERLEEYRTRDRETLTDSLVARMIAEGRLPDPAPFSLEANCAGAAQSVGAVLSTAPGSPGTNSSDAELMQ
jgi:hypothetical protein